MASCIRSAPSQLVEARSDDDDEDDEAGRYWREVIPSFGGDGRDMGSGGCAMVVVVGGSGSGRIR